MVAALTAEQRALAADHVPYSRALACEMAKGLSRHRGDTESWAAVGLCSAAARFDERRGVKFTTFARRRIVGAMIEGIRGSYLIQRGKHWRERPLCLVEETHAELMPDPRPDPERALIAAETIGRLRASIAELPERERTIIVACWFSGRTLEDVSADLGLSKSWACRLLSKAELRLQRELSK
jgi:RNA polymerase sigma factor FliA